VDVSSDGGNTWIPAELQKPNQPENRKWSWTIWKADLELPKDKSQIDLCCKAVDSSYNTQPGNKINHLIVIEKLYIESVKGIWNLRGLLNNSWHHVHVNIKKE
jgi:sulfite oxidase